MPDPDYGVRGLYDKFTVTRNDASPRHVGCRYFVLDLTHDASARVAARAYAAAQRADEAQLSADLLALVESIEHDVRGDPCPGPCGGVNRVHPGEPLGVCIHCGPKS